MTTVDPENQSTLQSLIPDDFNSGDFQNYLSTQEQPAITDEYQLIAENVVPDGFSFTAADPLSSRIDESFNRQTEQVLSLLQKLGSPFDPRKKIDLSQATSLSRKVVAHALADTLVHSYLSPNPRPDSIFSKTSESLIFGCKTA